MTKEQRYHRRLARRDGEAAVRQIIGNKLEFVLGTFPTEYRGVGSVYVLARSAAWHAFKAHPELREAA